MRNGSGTRDKSNEPGWADGLRQIYDSVVNEPLPDNFKDLLSKLDDKN
ncbi:NepR family anti-sigma factor [Altererythrobacter sp. MF3-039]